MPEVLGSLWSTLELARKPLAWKVLLSVLWDNTSWYLMMTCALTVVAVIVSWLYFIVTGLSAADQQAYARAVDSGNTTEVQEPSSTTSSSAADDEPLSVLVDTTQPLPPGRLKRAEREAMRRRLEQDMTDEQKRQERQSETDQMAAILDLMQQNSDKFGNPSLEDMQSQMRLYL